MRRYLPYLERYLGKPYDLDMVAALWVLGDFPPERMPDVAAEAMVMGFDTPHVLNLASFAAARLDGIGDAVADAFADMGRPLPSQDEAGLRVARVLARAMLAGELSELEWARCVHDLSPSTDTMHHVVSMLWLEEDYGPNVAAWRREVLALARDLLDSDTKFGPGPGAPRL